MAGWRPFSFPIHSPQKIPAVCPGTSVNRLAIKTTTAALTKAAGNGSTMKPRSHNRTRLPLTRPTRPLSRTADRMTQLGRTPEQANKLILLRLDPTLFPLIFQPSHPSSQPNRPHRSSPLKLSTSRPGGIRSGVRPSHRSPRPLSTSHRPNHPTTILPMMLPLGAPRNFPRPKSPRPQQ